MEQASAGHVGIVPTFSCSVARLAAWSFYIFVGQCAGRFGGVGGSALPGLAFSEFCAQTSLDARATPAAILWHSPQRWIKPDDTVEITRSASA